MPNETGDKETKPVVERVTNDREDENRFSQDDDDLAGRSWHGLNSEIEMDEVGRFEEDIEEASEPRPGRTERV